MEYPNGDVEVREGHEAAQAGVPQEGLRYRDHFANLHFG